MRSKFHFVRLNHSFHTYKTTATLENDKKKNETYILSQIKTKINQRDYSSLSLLSCMHTCPMNEIM